MDAEMMETIRANARYYRTTRSSMATEISALKPGGKSQMPCLWIYGN